MSDNVLAAIDVVTAPICMYCRRAESSRFCGRCRRVLCPSCYEGLQCRQGKCWPRPDGEGVR